AVRQSRPIVRARWLRAHNADDSALSGGFRGFGALHYGRSIRARRRSRPRLEALRMSRLHLEPAEVAGESSVRVTGGLLEPVILCGARPRIVGLERGGSNLFAVCPPAVLDADGMGPLRLHGRHRL